MGADSKIAWTKHTFNPWWGCQRVSPGCERCYAETFAKRLGKKIWGPTAERRFFGAAHWAEPLKWNAAAAKAGERHRVFCASMGDVFEDRPDLAGEREKLWALIQLTPHLDWLLLTKRPENIRRLLPSGSVEFGRINEHARVLSGRTDIAVFPTQRHGMVPLEWPLPNVWLGTTVEDQQRAEERIPHLIVVPAKVRFLSCEPLLGPLNLSKWMDEDELGFVNSEIDWVIIGGESGPGARPFDFAWARSLIWQCRNGGRTIEPRPFLKQLGAAPRGDWGTGTPPTHHLTDITVQPRRESIELSRFKNGRWRLRDRAGADPAEWPEDLRVREFPEVSRG